MRHGPPFLALACQLLASACQAAKNRPTPHPVLGPLPWVGAGFCVQACQGQKWGAMPHCVCMFVYIFVYMFMLKTFLLVLGQLFARDVFSFFTLMNPEYFVFFQKSSKWVGNPPPGKLRYIPFTMFGETFITYCGPEQ